MFANSRSKLFKLSLPGFSGATLAINVRPALVDAKPVAPFAKAKILSARRR